MKIPQNIARMILWSKFSLPISRAFISVFASPKEFKSHPIYRPWIQFGRASETLYDETFSFRNFANGARIRSLDKIGRWFTSRPVDSSIQIRLRR